MSRENHSDQQAGQTDGRILNSHKSGGTTVTVTGPRGRRDPHREYSNGHQTRQSVVTLCAVRAHTLLVTP